MSVAMQPCDSQRVKFDNICCIYFKNIKQISVQSGFMYEAFLDSMQMYEILIHIVVIHKTIYIHNKNILLLLFMKLTIMYELS